MSFLWAVAAVFMLENSAFLLLTLPFIWACKSEKFINTKSVYFDNNSSEKW